MKVLLIAAHPDDEVLGPGGTMLKHQEAGDEVITCIAYKCRVERTAPDIDWWLLPAGSDPLPTIEASIATWRPDVVYTHFAGDINADHRRVSEAVRVACRPYAAPSVHRLLEFYTPSSTEWGEAAFKPNVYVDISDHIAAKTEAMLKHYESEMRPFPHPRSAIALVNTAAFWGSHVGYAAAEPFVLVRER
jgi:LmbE family N-acetylglucosaminyl deacetylase